MVTYQCHDCRYRFTPKGGKVPSICPYCSRPGIAPVKGMQELLDETGAQE